MKEGGQLSVKLTVQNDGYAAPFLPRTVELVLRPVEGGSVQRFALSADPRRWAPGTTTVSETVQLTGVPAGTYALLLSLSDPAQPARPEYSIRLANVGLWEPETGENALQHTVAVVR